MKKKESERNNKAISHLFPIYIYTKYIFQYFDTPYLLETCILHILEGGALKTY